MGLLLRKVNLNPLGKNKERKIKKILFYYSDVGLLAQPVRRS